MDKIRVLYYEPSSGYGGSSRCLRDWLIKLDKERFQPFVAVLDDGPVIKEISELGFNVLHLVNRKGSVEPAFTPELVSGYWNFFIYLFKRILPLTFRLAREMRARRIDIVHINTPVKTGLEAVLAAKLTGRRSICHLHETRNWSRVERYFSPLVSRFICLTERAGKMYRQYVGGDKLVRIYNGIDLGKISSREYEGVRREFALDTSTKLVGIVGRITDGKGHDIFIRSARKVLESFPATKCVIVGDILTEEEKSYKARLMKLINELGIDASVIVTGWRDDAKRIISAMNVMVQASTTFPEGLSMTCLEAMSFGVPLVVTDIPGADEIVIDSETGLVVPPANPDAMAEAICTILSDSVLADKFSKASRKRVEDVFELEKIIRQIEELYNSLVAASQKR